MKAVFESSTDTAYDDQIASHYHFPKQYLKTAESTVGDWIVYREPFRGGGSGGYFAVARVKDVKPDPDKDNHYYASVDYYLSFDVVVPLHNGIRYYEDNLNKVPKRQVGTALKGNSVRNISEDEFVDIALAGLSVVLNPENATALDLEEYKVGKDVIELINAPEKQKRRHVIQILLNRKIRDASFRRTIMDAYDSVCAISGVRIINGKGRAEAQAAHIVPVADHGPDTVDNGISLSSTCHWLFDRHLISLTDDYGLIAKEDKIPREILNLISRGTKRIHLPEKELYRPRIDYIQQHREIFMRS